MYIPTRDDNELVFVLSSAMSQIYANEIARAAKVREILADYGIVTMATKVDGTEYKTDGDVQSKRLRFLIIDVKLEISPKVPSLCSKRLGII
jgi:hypothetical protein